MKSIATLLVLLGSAALLPAQAQTTTTSAERAATASANGPQRTLAQDQAAGQVEEGPKLSRREQRKAKKGLTPYAQAVLNNELFRDEPKSNENGKL
ncbi:hypothetical protein CDA63_02795 [Hymenobacter amundsenii]|uniref:DUF4148 domain-containing protein n=1 Tax=Hymenobacter amundsenii TaxID=2006685 RepID=A0A246FPN1_9BACT|nr:hypothetical protein [Hymenobacter amundsenii]OWP64703.1 hypothetical protein CDA63_02795 [Hymenobacter amundsenii]